MTQYHGTYKIMPKSLNIEGLGQGHIPKRDQAQFEPKISSSLV